jgi:hypothetical protein
MRRSYQRPGIIVYGHPGLPTTGCIGPPSATATATPPSFPRVGPMIPGRSLLRFELVTHPVGFGKEQAA